MYKKVKSVKPLSDYKLLLTFENEEKRIFDMKPYLAKGIYEQLKDQAVFNSVRLCFDTIEWNNGADLCPEVLFNEGIPV